MSGSFRLLGIIVLGLATAACGSMEQRHRDDLRFATTKRGTESYRVDATALRYNEHSKSYENQDSFSVGQKAALNEIEFYRRYREIVEPGKHGLSRAELMSAAKNLQDGQTELQRQLRTLQQQMSEISSHLPPPAFRIPPRDDAGSPEPPRSSRDMMLAPPRQTPSGGSSAIPGTTPLLQPIRFVPPGQAGQSRPAEPVQARRSDGFELILPDNGGGGGNGVVDPAVLQSYLAAIAREQDAAKKKLLVDQFILLVNAARDRPQAELFWPAEILKHAQTTTTTKEEGGTKTTTVSGLNDEMVKALSSTASVAQMRDLMTEPAFPAMLPMERHVDLGCVLPPDSVAWEAATKLELVTKVKNEVDVGLSTEYKSAVVKLFEESEKTLFLQYALFRLCEMSINAPAGFRNIYPVIIHDIVRRTAEMKQQDIAAIEGRRAEEHKVKQKALEVEVAAKAAETQAEKTKTEAARKAATDAETALAAKRAETAAAEAASRKEIAYQSCLAGGMNAAAGDSAKLDALEKSCQKFK